MTPTDPPADAAPDPRPPRRRERRGQRGRDRIALLRRDAAAGTAWEIVQPRCARQRREDIEEVEAMVEAGETDIARDELVWLLTECPDFIDAHVQLGLIALEEDDPRLARGHFGRAYELCLQAVEAAGGTGPVPYALPGNQPFHQAAKGLVHCLMETGRRRTATEVCRRMLVLDPADALGLARIAGRP
ncbi:MAG: hypothetical protein ACK6CT_15165 [Planctomycetia bacterium]|jgi:hypothetical protein